MITHADHLKKNIYWNWIFNSILLDYDLVWHTSMLQFEHLNDNQSNTNQKSNTQGNTRQCSDQITANVPFLKTSLSHNLPEMVCGD